MKAVLLVSIIALFASIGFGVAGSYYERKRFFFNLLEFLKQFKSYVNYSSIKLTEILKKEEHLGDINYKKLIKNYSLMLCSDKGFSVNELFEGISILTAQEKEDIGLFFKGLGTFDLTTQIEQIDGFYLHCNNYLQLASEDAKKYGALYSKLGIIVGAFIALIIM